METSESNPQRYELLNRLQEAARIGDPDARQWCDERRDVLLSLLKDVDVDQVDWLISLGNSRGLQFFQDKYVILQVPVTCDECLPFVC